MTSAADPPVGTDRRRLVLGTVAAGAKVAVGGSVLASIPVSAAQPAGRSGCVPATFWQPLLADRDRGAAHWLSWMAALRRLGVTRLIVQHSALEPYDVLLPGAAPDDAGRRLLADLLAAARRHGVQVWMGLSYDPAHFEAVAADDPSRVQAYLQMRLQRMRRVVALLSPSMRHPSVRGWYLSDEIDDLSWASVSRGELLRSWLAEATAQLRAAAPNARIAVSGFVNARQTTPADLAQQWQRWFEAAPALDELLFQDGVGAGKVPLDQSAAYLAAVAEVARRARRRFTPVVELFEAADAAATGNGWRAAPFERVARQIAIARSTARSWAAFSVPEYAGPETPGSRALRDGLGARCAVG